MVQSQGCGVNFGPCGLAMASFMGCYGSVAALSWLGMTKSIVAVVATVAAVHSVLANVTIATRAFRCLELLWS